MKSCCYGKRLATRKYSLDILNLGHMSFVLVTDRRQCNWYRRHALWHGTRSCNCTSIDLWTCSFEVWNVLTSDTERKTRRLWQCHSKPQLFAKSDVAKQIPATTSKGTKSASRLCFKRSAERLARGTIFTATQCHNVYSIPVESMSSTKILAQRCRSMQMSCTI